MHNPPPTPTHTDQTTASPDESAQRVTAYENYQRTINSWLSGTSADAQTRASLLIGGATNLIQEFSASNSLTQRPELHSFITALSRGLAAAYWDAPLDAVDVLNRHMVLGVQRGRAFLGVSRSLDVQISSAERRRLQDLLVAMLRRILGAREARFAIPRQLDVMWMETTPAGRVCERIYVVDTSPSVTGCFDLAGCLRGAGGESLLLRTFIWANVFLSWPT